MELVAEVGSLDVVSDASPITHTERTTTLLSGGHSRLGSCRTVALGPFVGVRIGGNRTAEEFLRDEVQVRDVVRVRLGGIGSGRSLGNTLETVPCDTIVVGACVVDWIQHSFVDAGLVPTFTNLIPNKSRHWFPSL